MIYQRRRVKMRKTSIKRANLNPVYHECLEFDLPPSQINETNLLVQVMDWDRIGRDDLLGCCVIGRESPTKEGRQQWAQCFAGIRLSSDSAPLMSHSVSADPDHLMGNGCTDNETFSSNPDSKFLLGVGCAPQMSVSQYDDECRNEDGVQEKLTENGGLYHLPVKMAQSAPTSAKTSTISGANGQVATDGVPRAVGVWYSILGEIPDEFQNIQKVKKK